VPQNANDRYLAGLLRRRREGPCCGTTYETNKFAPPHARLKDRNASL
jgi:hypothetical protein